MEDLRRELEVGRRKSFFETLAANSFKHKEPEDDNSRKLKARRELLDLIKSRPNWQQALKVQSEVQDVEIIAQLARADSPRATMKLAGCSAVEATQAANKLLPLALEYKSPPPRKKWYKRIGCRALCIGSSVFFAFLCLVGYLYYLLLEKAGWISAECSITQFSNSSFDKPCTGNCLFDIAVRNREENELLTKYSWQPALSKDDYRSGTLVTLKDDVFRCCNIQDCCSFIDSSFRFCDNWPERESQDGEPCPRGDWPCLYKAESNDPKVVKDLKPDYETPMERILLYMLIAFVLTSLLVAIVGHSDVSLRIEKCFAHCLAKLYLWIDEEERHMIAAEKKMSEPELPKIFQRRAIVELDNELISQFAAHGEYGEAKRDAFPDNEDDIEQIVAYDVSYSVHSRRSDGETDLQYEAYKTTESMKHEQSAGATSGRSLREIAEESKKNGHGNLFRPIITPPARIGTRGVNLTRKQTMRSEMARNAKVAPHANAQQRTDTQQRAFALATIDDRSPTGLRMQKRIEFDAATKRCWTEETNKEAVSADSRRLPMSNPSRS
eukprot:CAMPEP_0169263694 /NCGR_PEP_ID=MMETSP1016-20121227/44590_1 /TAXON_ID=342587 /ORGANISM="Karlodinium micrum, Strain CCMP2283" /LENGTH=552 /DNA_ID=CAMNT_0009346729 /DNA_START=43 /DNA_END=1698 /DNA_ORIENTATION=-